MTTKRRLAVGLLAVLLPTVLVSAAQAGMINVGTASNAANWLITGAGATNAPAFQVFGGDISLTSNAARTGTFISGGSYANFDGLWVADETFFLPAGATGVSLNFSGLMADDRTVLELNGTMIGNAGISGSTGQPTTGPGFMKFPPEPSSDVPFTFTGQTSGTVTSGFVLGGQNTLRLVVNNTGAGITGFTTKPCFDDDFTAAGVSGTVTFADATATPEPSALALFGLGGAALVAWGRWGRRITCRRSPGSPVSNSSP